LSDFEAGASGLNSWADKKAKDLDTRDFEHKNSKDLAVLIEELKTFRENEKPPK